MYRRAPKLDSRTGAGIVDLLKGDRTVGQGPDVALFHILGRFAEIIIERLNQAPDKNFLAFLDLLGASPLPPQPARVPLTFTLPAKEQIDAIVPIGTQVAALPSKGEATPVIFETQRELVVTQNLLDTVCVCDPARDRYADLSQRFRGPLTDAQAPSLFRGDRLMEHHLYIGDLDLLNYPLLNEVDIAFKMHVSAPEGLKLRWEIWDGKLFVPITPRKDATGNLVRSGEVVFVNLPQCAEHVIEGTTSRWLRCRLLTAISHASDGPTGTVPATHLPLIRNVTVRSEGGNRNLSLEMALANSQRLDLTKDFLPLGPKPQFGDVFYLTCREAFSTAGAVVILHVWLTNPISGPEPSPIPRVNAVRNPVLAWEYWNGSAWTGLEVTDDTKHLTDSGTVTFTVPTSLTLTSVSQGVESAWLRVRLISGDYGEPERFQPIDPAKPTAGYQLVTSSLAPPSIRLVTVDYTVKRDASCPQSIVTYNDFRYDVVKSGEPFAPFKPAKDTTPSLYFGFDLRNAKKFPNRSISLYFKPPEALKSPLVLRHAKVTPELLWEYWNGRAWTQWTVLDDTASFTREGLIRFLAPADIARREEFGCTRYWLRAAWNKGEYEVEPKLRLLLMNTTLALQLETQHREILGSSNLTKNQKFRAMRAPVLPGQQLEVRELEPPTATEQEKIQEEEGDDAISPREGVPSGREVWVRWHEVPDLYGSEQRDRHYILDHLTGEIQFGDGVNGLIPPAGGNNIRLARYQTGGGTAGNKPANTVVQLRTTIPGINKVVNLEAASGGTDAEPIDSLVVRAARSTRHRDRAVALEDYKDLAKLASQDVARARCVPLYDLSIDPDGAQLRPGIVSLILVPVSGEDKPVPNPELIRRVREYLDLRRSPAANLVIVGAEYVCVHVDTELVLSSPEDANYVQLEAGRRLSRFLHPLTGGMDDGGWDFGRRPHKSDLLALLQDVPGVEYVRSLYVTEVEDRPGAALTDRFLVYSGKHQVIVTLQKTE